MCRRTKQTPLSRSKTMQTNTSVNSSSSSPTALYHCLDSRPGLVIAITFICTKISLLLPLSLLVLHMGHQRWRQQRSFATMSHLDIFTFHLAVMELIFALGTAFFFGGKYSGLSQLAKVGLYVSGFTFPGEMFFHVLTCVERYLAVVHPVTYLGLRRSGGVRIRNISIGCVWLLCLGWNSVTSLHIPNIPSFTNICSLIFSLNVVSFCSLRVLCVLIRPGPGEVGGNRERVDQSKQRAFHTILAIMGVLWLWFAGLLVDLVLNILKLLSDTAVCVVLLSANYLTLPSSLTLPLLFLHRAGKLPHCH